MTGSLGFIFGMRQSHFNSQTANTYFAVNHHNFFHLSHHLCKSYFRVGKNVNQASDSSMEPSDPSNCQVPSDWRPSVLTAQPNVFTCENTGEKKNINCVWLSVVGRLSRYMNTPKDCSRYWDHCCDTFHLSVQICLRPRIGSETMERLESHTYIDSYTR